VSKDGWQKYLLIIHSSVKAACLQMSMMLKLRCPQFFTYTECANFEAGGGGVPSALNVFGHNMPTF
jgi:hypothetical protein